MWNQAPTPNRYAYIFSQSILRFSCFLLWENLSTLKIMDNLNVDWSTGWILSCFFGCEGKIHKPKPWINQACKEIHTATLGMKLTSVVCKLEIKINLSKSKVKLHPYSKSISTTKCVISPYSKSICTTKCGITPLLQIDMHHLPLLEPVAFSM